jgi:hypothetical protein
VHVIDHGGRTRAAARLANDGLTVGKLFESLGEPAMLEAGWTWRVMYDWLVASDNVVQVELAPPPSADDLRGLGQDRRHRRADLTQLLCANLIPRAYIPESRDPPPARNRPSTSIPGAGANHG